MSTEKSQQPSHAERVARRAFIKKAAVGAAFAVPVLESITKSDLLLRSALAATAPLNSAQVPTRTITTSVYPLSEGTGTVLAIPQTVVNGGNVSVTVTPTGASYWWAYRIDAAPIWTFVPGFQQLPGGIV